MKRVWFAIMMAGLLSSTMESIVSAEQTPVVGMDARTSDESATAEPKPKFVVDLVDGSRIVGVPSVKGLDVILQYGRFNVPLKTLEEVIFNNDGNPAVVSLANKDRLSGGVDFKYLRLETVWGTVEIGQEHLKRMVAVHNPAGIALPGTGKGHLAHGIENLYADEDSLPVQSGNWFWINYDLDSAKMIFSAQWGYENGGGENGVTALPITRTSSGWNARGMADKRDTVRFEQTQQELRMEWGPRIEQNGLQLLRVVWPNALEGRGATALLDNEKQEHKRSDRTSCINNLRLIDHAKQQWATANNKQEKDTPNLTTDIVPYLKSMPRCPAGGTYTVGNMAIDPRCSLSGPPDLHVLP